MFQQGTIRAIHERGFGFIEPSGAGGDCFFHVCSLRGLEFDHQLIGRRVEFEMEVTAEGKTRARVVRAAK